MVTWGTNPGMVTQVSSRVPDPTSFSDPVDREAAERALVYMDLKPGTPIEDIPVDRVFIGSCTNSRLEDLRAAAKVVAGRHVAKSLKQALVVPGSRVVKAEAEAEGLDKIFRDAGFEWRDAGCSMCIGMNDDVLPSGERSASTSNRNFEGRQGKGGRTHLVSPVMAAAAAIEGHFVDIRKWKTWTERNSMEAFHQAYRIGGAAGPRERGHRSDGAEAISETADAARVTGACFFTTGAICRARSRIRNLC